MMHAPTWVNPEDIILSEISQTQNKYCMVPLYSTLIQYTEEHRENIPI